MIKLVAIDLDGTLFDNQSQVPEENRKAIEYLAANGIYPVISTGRPFGGIPKILTEDMPFTFAITANGGAVYEVKTGKLVCENGMTQDIAFPLLDFLISKDIHLDAYVNGQGISTYKCIEAGQKLPLPPSLKKYVLESRIRVNDLKEYIAEKNAAVQKITMNFYQDQDGTWVDRDQIQDYLDKNPNVDCVCGGYHNLEFTKAGVNKGLALKSLAQYLGLSLDETMAIGDTENDFSIVQTAGMGVAMGNATQEIKNVSNYITDTNEECGVAKAIYHFCKKETLENKPSL